MSTYWQSSYDNQIERVNQVSKIANQVNTMWPGAVSRRLMDRLGNVSNYQSAFSHDVNGYQTSLEVPGYGKENIKVAVDPANRILTLTVTNYKNVEEGEIVLQQRLSIPIGANVSKDPIAKLELGILTVTFSEDEDSQPREIEITIA